MTLETKEKHLNRFSKTCYDARCMCAKIELDKETERGNFWAKKYHQLEADNEQLKLRNAELQVKICHLEADTQKKIQKFEEEVESWIDNPSDNRSIKDIINQIFGDTETKQITKKQ